MISIPDADDYLEMVPVQFFPSEKQTTPEKYLLLAILIDAIACCSGKGIVSTYQDKISRAHEKEAWEWVMSDERSKKEPVSDFYYDYLTTCEILNINPYGLRRGLMSGTVISVFHHHLLRKPHHGQYMAKMYKG